ncbi:MAG: preprotein translocase subunit YajC [Planctomycetes bacterium]|nr:preprotein translocase subunit YajC [Planctomycetota bacterium]
MSQLPFLAIMIAIFYFLLIRPQQKQEKARREMLSAIQKGDRVVTASGIHGRIAQLDEQTVSLNLDVEGKIRVTFDRAAIARVVRDAEAEGKGKAGGS